MFLLSMTCSLFCSIRLQRNAAPMLPITNSLHRERERAKWSKNERGSESERVIARARGTHWHMYLGIQMLCLCGGNGAAAIGPPTWRRLRASFAVSVAAASSYCCICECCCYRSELPACLLACLAGWLTGCLAACLPVRQFACLERGNFFFQRRLVFRYHSHAGIWSSLIWGWEQLLNGDWGIVLRSI